MTTKKKNKVAIPATAHPKVQASKAEEQLIQTIASKDWTLLTFVADQFIASVESVHSVDGLGSMDAHGRALFINLGHAEAAAAAKKDIDTAQVIVAHRLGQVLNKYCPERKGGRPDKDKPSEDRTVYIDEHEFNFDQLLRECGAGRREREWDLRKAGSRSTDEFYLWLNNQRAKKKKPTLGGWLSEIKKKEKMERNAQRTQKALEAHSELEAASELGKINEWVPFYNCRFQDLHERIKIPPLDGIVTDPPYDRAAIDCNLFSDLADFADKHLKQGAPLVMMVGQCHLLVIIQQVTGKGVWWLRWVLAVKYDGENHLSQPYAVNSKFKAVLVFQRESERKAGVEFGSIQEDWVQAGKLPDDTEDFHDWKQEWTTFDSILSKFVGIEPGSMLCDPCAGWATTLIACIRREYKMKCIGCEVLTDRHFEGQGEIEIAWQEIFGGRSSATKLPTELPPSIKPALLAEAKRPEKILALSASGAKPDGNMYKDAAVWNPFYGCKFDCIYCEPSFKHQAKRQKQNCITCSKYEPHTHPERLKTSEIPKTPIVFVCGYSDIAFCPPDFMRKIIAVVTERSAKHPDQVFYFQSKRPSYLKPFLKLLPKSAIAVTTLETNRDAGYEKISNAPKPSERFKQFLELDYPRKVVTIEPVLDFDVQEFADMIISIKPEYVWLGLNSKEKRVQLPEPSPEKLREFVKILVRSGIEIKGKKLRGLELPGVKPKQ